MQLVFETGHIIFGYDLRMDLVLDGKVLCGQTESIPSHGIQYVVALHSSLSGDDIQSCVRTRMSNVKALS